MDSAHGPVTAVSVLQAHVAVQATAQGDLQASELLSDRAVGDRSETSAKHAASNPPASLQQVHNPDFACVFVEHLTLPFGSQLQLPADQRLPAFCLLLALPFQSRSQVARLSISGIGHA